MVGIAIGLAGIILLNSGGNLKSGNPWGAIYDPDRFDELGIWFRLRLAHRPALMGMMARRD